MLWRRRNSTSILLGGLIVFMVLGAIASTDDNLLWLFAVGLVVFVLSALLAGD